MPYRVTWWIDVEDEDADDPVEAAQYARRAQTRRGTLATVFVVRRPHGRAVFVDLAEREPTAQPVRTRTRRARREIAHDKLDKFFTYADRVTTPEQ